MMRRGFGRGGGSAFERGLRRGERRSSGDASSRISISPSSSEPCTSASWSPLRVTRRRFFCGPEGVCSWRFSPRRWEAGADAVRSLWSSSGFVVTRGRPRGRFPGGGTSISTLTLPMSARVLLRKWRALPLCPAAATLGFAELCANAASNAWARVAEP